jgi:hypothetical protein
MLYIKIVEWLMMKKIFIFLFIFMLLIGCAGYGERDSVDQSAKFLKLLMKEEYKPAWSMLSPEMKEEMPTEKKIEELWKNVIFTLGELKSFDAEGAKISSKGNFSVVEFLGNFEKGMVRIQVTVDEKGSIAGFYFLPYHGKIAEIPAYADPEAFLEEEVSFYSGNWKLNGNLTIPKGRGKVPAVVIVHGSGPMDRDGSVVGCRPYRDIAYGLSSRGVAVLRYDKRTLTYRGSLDPFNITIEEEVIADALAAIEFVSKDSRIDRNKVFLLGHSLGGMLAPEIASKSKDLSGIVMLSPPARNILDLALEQLRYVALLDNELSEEERRDIDRVEKQIERLRSHEVNEKELILGAPAAYWYGLEKRRPLEMAKELDCKILILQGGKDYQVGKKDFEMWEGEVGDRSTFIFYPSLNHLMVEVEGKPSPQDYYLGGNVDERVIMDISKWIEKV